MKIDFWTYGRSFDLSVFSFLFFSLSRNSNYYSTLLHFPQVVSRATRDKRIHLTWIERSRYKDRRVYFNWETADHGIMNANSFELNEIGGQVEWRCDGDGRVFAKILHRNSKRSVALVARRSSITFITVPRWFFFLLAGFSFLVDNAAFEQIYRTTRNQ